MGRSMARKRHRTMARLNQARLNQARLNQARLNQTRLDQTRLKRVQNWRILPSQLSRTDGEGAPVFCPKSAIDGRTDCWLESLEPRTRSKLGWGPSLRS